jgi:hypothetical protein
MPNIADVAVWSKETLENVLRSLYFSKKVTVNYEDRKSVLNWVGWLDGLSAVALYVGIQPSVFIHEDDLRLMKITKRY